MSNLVNKILNSAINHYNKGNKMTDEEHENKEPEKLTPTEIMQIRDAKTNAVITSTVAEKAYAQAKVAQLEVQNIILGICNKYRLDVSSGDNITEDGTIIRTKSNE